MEQRQRFVAAIRRVQWAAVSLALISGCRDRGEVERPPVGDIQSTAATTPDEVARVVEEHWPSGQLKMRRHVISTSDGRVIQHGPLEVWYESGGQRSAGNWANNQKHGPFKFWHENGQPKAEVTYRHGKADGTAVFRDEAGQELRRETWRDGERVHSTAGETQTGEPLPE